MKKEVTNRLHGKLLLVGLIIAVMLPTMAVLVGTATPAEGMENNSIEETEDQPVQTEDADRAEEEIQASVALPTMEQEKPVVESSKEIVKDVLLSEVPAADYSYSFDGKLDNAVAVTRSGDEGGFNAGTYPETSEDILPLFTDGMEGDALYLDGTYGVELLGVESLADSYTISFWLRADQLCDWSPFLVIGSNLLDADATQNYISFNKKSTEEGDTVVPVYNTVSCTRGNSCEIRPSSENKRCVNLNEWTYITICVDGTQVSEADSTKVTGYLYVNSELVGSGEVSKLDLDENNLKAYVGINCFDELYKASFDEIHIWNSLLSERQISAMYMAYIQN